MMGRFSIKIIGALYSNLLADPNFKMTKANKIELMKDEGFYVLVTKLFFNYLIIQLFFLFENFIQNWHVLTYIKHHVIEEWFSKYINVLEDVIKVEFIDFPFSCIHCHIISIKL